MTIPPQCCHCKEPIHTSESVTTCGDCRTARFSQQLKESDEAWQAQKVQQNMDVVGLVSRQYPALMGIFRCPACNRVSRSLRLLPCGHSFCQDCLKTLAISLHRVQGHDAPLPCPLCGTDVSTPTLDQLPLDHQTLDLLDMMVKLTLKSNSGPNKHTCDLCRLSDYWVSSVSYCENCAKNLCESCFEWHCGMTTFATHKVIQTTQHTTEDLSSAIECTEHQLPFQYVCLKCERLLCSKCTLVFCLDHEFKDLAVAAETRKAELHKLQEEIGNALSKAKDKERVLQGLDDRNEHMLRTSDEAIRQQTQLMIAAVQESGRRMMDKLYRAHETMQSELTKEMRFSEIQTRVLQTMQDVLISLDGPGRETLMLSTMPAIRSKALLKINTKGLKEIDDLNIVFTPHDNVNIGKIELVNKSNDHHLTTPEKRKSRSLTPTSTSSTDGSSMIKVEMAPTVADLTGDVKLSWKRRGLGYGWDVDILPAGHIALSDIGEYQSQIKLFTPDGMKETDINSEIVEFSDPSGVIYHPRLGALLVADPGLGLIKAIDPTKLTHMRDIHMTHVDAPMGLSVNQQHQLIVTQVGGSRTVSIHNIDGNCVKMWSARNKLDIRAEKPYYVTTDRNGRIIVSDMGNHCIKVYNHEANLLLKFGNSSMANNFLRPGGIVVTDRNNIVVVHSSKDKHNKITAFSPDGQVIGTILDLDTQCGELRSLAIQNKELVVLGENFIHSYIIKETV